MSPPEPDLSDDGFLPSPHQRRLWALQRRAAEPLVVQAVVDLDRAPQTPSLAGALREALEHEVERWEILRTGFRRHPVLRVPVQVIGPPRLGWREVGGPALGAGDLEDAVRAAAAEDRAVLAGLVRGEAVQAAPLRATLLGTGRGGAGWRLLLTLPALCADAETAVLLLRSLSAWAWGESAGATPAGDEEVLQYADLAEWLDELASGENGESGQAYWRNRGVGAGLMLRLPFGRTGDTGASRPRSLPVALDPEVAAAARELAAVAGTEGATVALAAWRALLSRLTGEGPSVVAVTFDGRHDESLRGALGPLARSLPVGGAAGAAGDFAADLPFRALLEATGAELRADTGWQHSFSWEWFAAGAGEDPPALPFAFTACRIALPPATCASAEGGSPRVVALLDDAEPFHARVRWLEDATPSLHLDYDAARFDEPTMARVAEELATLLCHACTEPDRAIAELDVVGPVERRRIQVDFNRTAPVVAAATTLHGLVARSVETSPDAVAVVAGGRALTFAELGRRSRRLAHRLRSRGAGRGTVVAIALDRELDLPAALLAVLETGAAYLPIDPSYPPARVELLLNDARPASVVTRGGTSGALASFPGPVVRLDAEAEAIAAAPTTPLATPCSGDDLAYVLYTSGSTGVPKGIEVTHRGVVNYLAWAAVHYRVEAGRGAPVHSPIGFDLTVTSLFAPLVAGRPAELLLDANDLTGLLDALSAGSGYSFVKLTPAHVELLRQRMPPEEIAGWTSTLVVGGEALHGESLGFWRTNHRGLRVVNEYGPTETVVGCSVHEVAAGTGLAGPLPIGRPIGSMRLYVTDRFLRPSPVGVVGEVTIAGPGVARGYLRRPGLTAERFVPDPFGREPGGHLYRSGDLGRHGPSGEIELVGRLDEQVKVDGHRVELGEIEAALLGHPAVAEAAAAQVGTAGSHARLVAYVRLTGPAAAETDLEGMRRSLGERLPPYMVPSHLVALDRLPLTEHGKVDRKALPAPFVERGRHAWVAEARDPLELELVRLWEETLGLRPLGIDESFFGLGGNSLQAVRLLAYVHKRLGVDLPLATLFAADTVASLAAHLRAATPAPASFREPLVALRTDGARRPLFGVHPPGGNVLAYVHLSRHLPDDQPFYAIQDPRLYAPGPAGEVPELTVEAMAQSYVAAVRAVQRRGPYLLAGWSAGGTVAFEMARQLLAVGERVRILALIDTAVPFFGVRPFDDDPAPLDEPRMLDSLGRIVCRLLGREAPLLDAGSIRRLGADERAAYMHRVALATGFVPPGTGQDQVARLCAVFAANTAAVRRYRPPVIAQTLTLVRARDSVPVAMRDAALHGGLRDDEAFSWERLTRRSVRRLPTPGDHFTLVGREHARSLAAVLGREMEALQAIREDGWGMLSWGLGH